MQSVALHELWDVTFHVVARAHTRSDDLKRIYVQNNLLSLTTVSLYFAEK